MTRARNIATPEGAEAGKHLARMCDREEAKRMPLRPRCGTCAFRAGTKPNQMGGTVLDALKCAMEGKPFYCHETKTETVCAGWMILRNKPGEEVEMPYGWMTEP